MAAIDASSDSTGGQGPSKKPGSIYIALDRRWLLGVVVLLVLPWPALIFILVLSSRLGANSRSTPFSWGRRTEYSQVTLSNPGPWGQLEFVPVVISPPLEFIDAFEVDRHGNPWHFPSLGPAQVEDLLRKAGMDPTSCQRLMSTLRADPATSGSILTPPEDIVAGMSASTRGAIYNWLSSYETNLDQANALRYLGNSPSEWLSPAQLSSGLMRKVEPLIYRHGRFLIFADLRLVMPQAMQLREDQRLLKTLSSQKTFLVKLRVTSKAEIPTLEEYWGRGGRSKDIRPLLESLAEDPGVNSIDVVHLLPGFARRRLYTFPNPSNEALARGRDCHWTAMNFFLDPPDDRFAASPEIVVQELNTAYHRIDEEPRLGDVVIFLDQTGDIFHSAVFIADDVLYTKNGNRSCHPWMFMRIGDMADYYPTEGPIEIRYYRRNESFSSSPPPLSLSKPNRVGS